MAVSIWRDSEVSGQLEQVSLRAPDGADWVMAIERPASISPRAAILCIPAMGTPARFYQPLVSELARHGFVAAATELRGNGSSSVRASRRVDFGYHELLTVDLPVAVGALRERTPGLPLVLLGHSLGGQLAVLHAAIDGAALAGVVTVAACSVYLGGWPPLQRVAMGVGMHVAVLLAATLGYFPGRRLGFAGTEARGVMADWARNGRTGRYVLRNHNEDLDTALATATVPILAVSIEQDRLAPPRAVDNLMAKVPAAPVTRRHLGPGELPPAALDHFAWVKHPEGIVAELIPWLETITGEARAQAASPAPYQLPAP